MAFINKIFTLKKKNAKNCDNSGWNGFEFSEQQVRVVLFQEWQGRKLLFDSKAVRKIPLEFTKSAEITTANLSIPIDASQICDSPRTGNRRIRKLSTDSTKTSSPKKYPGSQQLSVSCDGIERKFFPLKTNDESPIKSLLETSNGFGYEYVKPTDDVSSLAEMIFGSVALTFRGTSLKVHSLNNKNDGKHHIMCTHVFYPPIRPLRQSVSNRAPQTLSTHSSLSEAGPSTLDISSKPGLSSWTWDVSKTDHLEVESGYGTGEQSAGSSISSVGPSSFPSQNDSLINDNNVPYLVGCSPTNLNRRRLRNFTTSLDLWPSNGILNSYSSQKNGDFYSGSFTTDNSNAANASGDNRRSSSGTEESFNINNSSKKIKLGLAVIIELTITQQKEMHLYLLEHMPLVDSMIWRLRDCVQRAYWRRNSFLSVMVDGCNEAARWIRNIMCPTMNIAPLWSQESLNDSLTSSFEDINKSLLIENESKSDIFWRMFFKSTANLKKSESEIEKFMRDFCGLLEMIDNKSTNFFLSAVITGILSHHLGWTLAMSNKEDHVNSGCALWAQLGDMYGAIGNPPRLAQTVVIGEGNTDIVKRILKVLSYFTRYNEIERVIEERLFSESDNDLLKQNYNKLQSVSINNSSNINSASTNTINLEMQTLSFKAFCYPENNNCEKTLESSFKRLNLHLVNNNNKHCNNNINGNSLTRTKSKPENSIENFSGSSYLKINDENTTNSLKRTKSSVNFDSNSTCDKKANNICEIIVDSYDQCLDELKLTSNNISKNGNVEETSVTKLNSTILVGEEETDSQNKILEDKKVVFVLGENEELIGIKQSENGSKRTSQSINNIEKVDELGACSVPTETTASTSTLSSPSKCSPRSPCQQRLKRYSGVKFNFEQYPQIATNYMKNKNLDITNHSFLEKGLKMGQTLSNFGELSKVNFSEVTSDCDCGFDECSEMVLQTPSNASELESTSDLPQKKQEYATEKIHEETEEVKPKLNFLFKKLDNTVIVDSQSNLDTKKDNEAFATKNNFSKSKNSTHNIRLSKEKDCSEKCPVEKETKNEINSLKLTMVSIPLPSSSISSVGNLPPAGYKLSMIRSGYVGSKYMPGAVLQGISAPLAEWSNALRRDLALLVRHSPLDQPMLEAVCVVADMENWTVQAISSSSLPGGLSGVPAGLNSCIGAPIEPSQLITDMLDSVLMLWKLRTPSQQCLQYIENKLLEIYVQSFAFSELLLATDFCDMNFLTNSLNLHPNDVPLLLAIASTHTPQVTQKYGVSFQ